MKERRRAELDRDEDEQRRERVSHVWEALEHVADDGVDRAQSEEREHVRRVDEERVLRDGEYGRNRVDGEDGVRRLDRDQRDQQRRRMADAVDADGESVALLALRDGQRTSPIQLEHREHVVSTHSRRVLSCLAICHAP